MIMRFNVGPWVYTLKITAAQIVEDGELLNGQADEGAREIRIAGTVIPEARLDVLLHELRHCWEFHFPVPRDAEEEANFTASIAAAAMQDLQLQGGRMALMGMAGESVTPPVRPDVRYVPCDDSGYQPVECVEGWQSKAPATAKRAQCGMCSLIVGDRSVVTGPVRWETSVGGRVVSRTLYCWHCEQLQSWVEGVDYKGDPNGAVVSGPEYLRGKPVAEFLEAHPEAAGLVVG
jgi:hypothetical protein